MINENNIFDFVDAYVKGSLSGDRLAMFEKELVNNPALTEAVADTKAIQQLMLQKRLLDVKSITQKTHAKSQSKPNTKLKFGILALVGVLAIGAGAYFTFQNEEWAVVPDKTPVERELPTIVHEEVQKKKIREDVTPSEETIVEKSRSIVEKQPQEESPTENVIPDVKNEDSLIVEEVVKNAPVIDVEPEPEIIEERIVAGPCDLIDIKLVPESTCFGKKEGVIQINILGVKSPYIERLFNSKNVEVFDFENLDAGQYYYSLIDDNGCELVREVSIKEKNCPMVIDFNPSMGDVWQLPVYEEEGVLSVFDRNGIEVLRMKLEADIENEWDGYQSNGELLIGYYNFTIKYQDGKFHKGNVTITE